MPTRLFDPRGTAHSGWRFEDWQGLEGVELARHRTGGTLWVPASGNVLGMDVVVKTYDYPTSGDRRRGWGRNTLLAPSRASREARHLRRLAERGVQPDVSLCYGEDRRCGVLFHCFVVTRAIAGASLDKLFAASTFEAQRSRIDRLAGFVRRLHSIGYVDRDLHLRNVLEAADGSLIKIDNPRSSFLVAPLAMLARRRDLRDLSSDLEALLGTTASRCFLEAYRSAASVMQRGGSTSEVP